MLQQLKKYTEDKNKELLASYSSKSFQDQYVTDVMGGLLVSG